MKKFFMVILSIAIFLNFSFVLARQSDENSTPNYYVDEEILKKIMFDYNFLTKNSEDETYKIFYSLKEMNENISEKTSYIESLNINKMSTEEKIIYIQSNYKELIDNMNKKQKFILDKYLIENALKYYYDILGTEYVYEEENNIVEQNGSYDTLSSENIATIKICADGSPNGASGGEGLDPVLGHHGWIQIHNLTTRTIKVGGLDIPSLCEVAVGTWPNWEIHTRNMVQL